MRGLTIPEFAFRAGLSAATVSAAVNSQPISYRSARLVVQALIDCPVFQEFADRVAAEV
jgi:DNA-binding LacI/PurR family transcriptional regulator